MLSAKQQLYLELWQILQFMISQPQYETQYCNISIFYYMAALKSISIYMQYSHIR